MRSTLRTKLAAALGAVALAGTVVVVSPPSVVHAAPVTLTFLNINDFHGRIDPTNQLTTKWATTIEQQRVIDPEAQLLSAGDNVSASLFNSAVANDQPTIDVLNAMGLVASAVGNHEFDKGFLDLSGRIVPAAQWTYLGANVYNKGTQTPALPEYKIVTVHGVTVGIIGAVTEETPTLVSPGGITTLDIGDPVDAVNRVADQLTDGNQANGEAQVLIAEYHEGAAAGDAATPPGTLASNLAAPAPNAFAKIVNGTSPKVAVLFTGHTHQLYAYNAPIPGDPTRDRPVLETGNYADHVGKVTLTVDGTTGAVASYTAVNLAPAAAEDLTFPKVQAVKTIVDNAKAYADTIGLTPIGSLTADITTAFTGTGAGYTGPGGTYVASARDDRSKESTIGDLVANALRDTLAPTTLGGAQIGVVNPGGLRAELFQAPDGVITYAEANNVLPFANNLTTTTLSGAQFKTMLEQQWQRDANGNVPTRAYLQLGLSDNVTYTYNDANPEGSKITSITINGAPYDLAGSYRIGTFSFLTTGGDNFRIVAQGTGVKDSGLVDRDGWIDYLKNHSPVKPDFARQAVASSQLPPSTTTLGTHLKFALSNLDLTSLGAPANTSLTVAIGGKTVGTTGVAGGAATVDMVVPFVDIPTGAQTLTATASPSGTTVTLPITVLDPRTFVSPAPQRLIDTREGQGLPKAPLQPGVEARLVVAGKFGIGNGASAVAVNITSVNAPGDGWVKAYACGTPPAGDTSNLNPAADHIVANLAVIPLDSTGAICFRSYTATDLVVDLQGWYPTSNDFTPVAPTRIADTRFGTGIPTHLTAGTVVTLPVAGRNGVAADASAVVLNLTAIAAVPGFVTAYPCGTPPPTASTVNAWPGHAIANVAYVGVGVGGAVCLVSNITTDLVVDLEGWYKAGATYHALTPVRALDTRLDGTPVTRGNVRVVPIAGLYGVPADATTVSVNVTADNATGPAWVKVFPCGQALPTASNNNTSPDRIVAAQALVPLGAFGSICIATYFTTDIIVDVEGWQTNPPIPAPV